MDDRSMNRLRRWMGLSANRRAGLGGVAAALLGIGLRGAGADAAVETQKHGKRSKMVQISGTSTFKATPDQVWAFVTDPESGASCSRAVQKVTSQSGDRFEVKVSFKRGAFNPSGSVEGIFSDMKPGASGRLSGTGKADAGGWLDHDLTFSLRPVQGGAATEADFTAEVVFYGMLSRISQKLLNKHVETTASKFVQCTRQTNGW